MCTAICQKLNNHYFGRNLDYEFSYKETVTITPRNYPFIFRETRSITKHYAIIGMAYVVDDYPLYYDGTNEMGLSIAGLSFPDNAFYGSVIRDNGDKPVDNITSFEFIPWILSQCETIEDVRRLLSHTRLVDIPFSSELPPSPLHFLISDKESSITVEPVRENGKAVLKIYDNPVGVLTNNPPFSYHMYNLCNYMNMSNQQITNKICDNADLRPYSRGMGALGLPGDLSSASRFIRAVFVKSNALTCERQEDNVGQFFHILGAVEQQLGCVCLEGNKFERTIYTSCCDMDNGIYYYSTYNNRRITAVDMHKENLKGAKLITINLKDSQNIFYEK